MKQLSCAYCKHFNDCTDSKSISDGFKCHRFTIHPCFIRWYYGPMSEVIVDRLAGTGDTLTMDEVYNAWRALEEVWRKTFEDDQALELVQTNDTFELKIDL